MNTQMSLVIANPCHANWDKMSSTEKGKFCASCTKEVVDFREKSKDDIIEYLENYKGEGQTCGQFSAAQIDVVGKNYINSSVWKRIGISFMALLGVFSLKEAKAQKPKMGKVAVKGDVSYKDWSQQSQVMDVIFFGSVKTWNGEKIAGAEVKFSANGKELGATRTIANGTFAIKLRADKSMKAIMMYTKAPGYEMKVNVIPEPQKDKVRMDVYLDSEIMVLGQIAIHVDTLPNDSIEKTSVLEADTTSSCSKIIEDNIEENTETDPVEDMENMVEPETNDHQDSTFKMFNTDLIEDKKWLRVYPNPTVTNATIEWKDNSENLVEVFDLGGKLVWKINVKGTHTLFNTANLKEGEYIVKITSATTQRSETARLIIQR